MSTLPSFLPPRVAYYEIAHLTDGPLTATKLNLWALAQPLLPFTPDRLPLRADRSRIFDNPNLGSGFLNDRHDESQRSLYKWQRGI